VLQAVKHLHANNICHRDLKLENVIFADQTQQRVKLIDFGMSKILSGVCMMNSKLGTPYYVAPEVLEGFYDKSCDLWSLGVLTYMLLSGEPPFTGKSVRQVFRRIATCDYSFEQPVWSMISDDAKLFIDALLQKKPETRSTAD
jgi:calcium-dependent protein kinase